MSQITRFIRQDNDDASIKYEPSSAQWSSTSKTSSIFQVGNLGDPVSPLLKTAVNGSVSFTFEGIAMIVVISYINPSDTPTESKVSCFVDGEFFGTSIPQSSQNNWQWCGSGLLQDGTHSVMMVFSTPVGSSQIFFDYLLYVPSSTEQSNSTDSDVSTLIESFDPAITYSGSFIMENDTDTAQLANFKNASITVPFSGQQLIWYGVYSTFMPSTPSLAEYSINGGTPTRFTLEPAKGSGVALLNQLLFQTEVLPQGSHQLTATYLGDAQAPLSLDFVVVRNFSNTITPNSTTAFPTPIPTPTPTFPSQSASTGSHNHQSHQSVIIGIVVGASIFLITTGIMLTRHIKKRVQLQCLKTRRKRKDEEKEERSDMTWSLNQDGTAPAVSIVTTTPDSASEINDFGEVGTDDSLLIPDRNAIFVQLTPADSTETLLNASLSYTTHIHTHTPTLAPFEIPSLPVVDFGKMAARSDNSNSSPLPLPLVDRTQEEKEAAGPGFSSDAATAQAITLQMLTTQPLRLSDLSFTGTPLNAKERHMDSGVRLGNRQTLIYDETSSAEWSLRSKRRLPPGYTHD